MLIAYNSWYIPLIKLVKKLFYALSEKMAKKHFLSTGSVLRKYRKDAKLTQSRLAKRMGVGHNYISEIERGKEFLSLEMLAKFSLHMKANPGEVFNAILEREAESENQDFPWVTLYKEIE